MGMGTRGMERGGDRSSSVVAGWCRKRSSEMASTVVGLLLLFWCALGLMEATAAAEVDADSPRWEVRQELVSMCAHPVLSFGLVQCTLTTRQQSVLFVE